MNTFQNLGMVHPEHYGSWWDIEYAPQEGLSDEEAGRRHACA